MTIEVSGGAGGVAADLAAMAATAADLGAAAQALTDLAGRLAAAGADVDSLATVLVDPAGWAESRRRLLAAAAGRSGLAVLAARAGALAAAVDAAATGYARADQAARAVVATARSRAAEAAGGVVGRVVWRYPLAVVPGVLVAVQAVLLWRTGDLPLAAAADVAADVRDGSFAVDSLDDRLLLLAVQAGARLRGDTRTAASATLGWLARHPGAAQQAVAATPAFLSGAGGLRRAAGPHGARGPGAVPAAAAGPSFPPGDVHDLAALAALVGYGTGLLGHGPVRVRPARVPAPPGTPPAGVADLVGRAVALAPERSGVPAAEPGRIRVERVHSPAGRAAVVYVPATQTWALGSETNPMDATGNLDAMAGIDSAAQSGVRQALRAAGVAPDEPLLLVGFSQGGLTSMALAGDPGFAEEFAPTAVLTVGAPVAGFSPPAGVEVLSIEHAEDLVTVLDGAANPDRAGWTTVRREVLDPDTGDPGVLAAVADQPLAPHDPGSYLRTAEHVDGSDHRSVLTWKERVRPFLAGAGATSSAADWVAERVPAPRAPTVAPYDPGP